MFDFRSISSLALALTCALLPNALHAQGAHSAPSPLSEFRTRFNQTLAAHGIVGGAYTLVSTNTATPPAQLFYGEASSTTHKKIDADTSYNWASITKTMTAIAILQLRDRGLLSLDDPAVKYVPELRQVHSAYGPIDSITIRQLLTHSAGFRNGTWPWECDQTDHCDWEPFEPTHWQQVDAMLPYTHIDFAPGAKWSYSNLGYVFLGQIIQRLSGDDFEVYIDKNILKPLEMHSSYFDRSPYFLTEHVSASYVRTAGKLTEQPFDFDTGITTSNSGLKAPITDMQKYARFLLGEPGNQRYETVLKRTTLLEMWQGTLPAVESGAAPTAYTAGTPHMGLGFFILDSNGKKIIFHDGDQGGFTSELLIDPTDGLATILVSNTTDTGGEASSATSASSASHAVSNTEPDANTDLRQSLRAFELNSLFPAIKSTTTAK